MKVSLRIFFIEEEFFCFSREMKHGNKKDKGMCAYKSYIHEKQYSLTKKTMLNTSTIATLSWA